MKKAEEEKKKGGSTGIFVVLLVITFGFLGGVLWLQEDVDAAQEVLEQSKTDYERMESWARSITKIRAEQKKIGGRLGVKPPDDPNEIPPYIAGRAKSAGVPPVRQDPGKPRVVGKGWTEYAFRIRVSGTKENLIKRASIVNWLATVERERPYLKVRDLTIDYDGEGIRKASVVISYLSREK